MNKINVSGKSFVDEYGRERIFNGINVCDKGVFNGTIREYSKEWDDELLIEFKKRGFNLIRLGTTWDAIEHAPGKYDDEYIDALGGILDKCAEHGIYAFIDMHQDLYSGFGNGAGDGAPDWACLTDGYKAKPMKFVWAEGYFWGKAVHKAFDNFWTNKKCASKGLLDYYADMWKHLATKLKDKPALFGFDMMNEPFPGSDGGKVFRQLVFNVIKVTLTDKNLKKTKLIGDALSKKRRVHFLDNYSLDVFKKIIYPSNGYIKKFDLERYSPFINKTASAIREGTDEGIMFVENCYYSNLGIPCSTPLINYDGEVEKKQCFAPHAYDFMVDTEAYKYANNGRVGAIFDEHKRTQERLGVPVVVGEWGGFSSGTEWFPHIKFLLRLFDSNKWSNTYWAYFGGLLNEPLADVLCRPYPQAVTGVIDDYIHDREAESFTLNYTQDKEFSVPTVIYLHKEPTSVETDGDYEVITQNCSRLLIVKTKPGRHKVTVNF